jgi:acetylornithine deacetylase/succinyl-diaminopimelate desuccinylase-like protein
MTTARTSIAQLRITRLATQLPVHRAFHWLHLHQPQLRQWQLEFLAIPAPTFSESARAAWFLEKFQSLGLEDAHIDVAGNVLAELPAQTKNLGAPFIAPLSLAMSGSLPEDNKPYILISAHLDTVFPIGTATTPRETSESTRIEGPGACDNGAGLTALLALAAALRFASITPPLPIVFAANTCEEGEGDLRGMRHLFTTGPYAGRIAAALALEGSGTATAVTRALGSRRFRVTIAGPGGHSWSDAAIPNPITLLSRAIAALADIPSLNPTAASDATRTTLSPGQIAGGTSINSIPQSATVHLDLRSTDATQLDHHATLIHQTFRAIIDSTRNPEIALTIDQIGDRPAASLPAESPLLDTLRAVDRHLNLRTELRLGSTDANIPLSLGIPAAALAAGGTGGGIHTLAEWYDPTGRETALRRILLTLLDLAQSIAAP